MKRLLLCMCLALATPLLAEELFWTFDNTGKESPVPPDCDGVFNEELGRFVLPTPEELYTAGNAYFFKREDEQRNAGYCFVAAALQGHLNAQYTLAQLYSKGMVLPKDDLAAYKWAFIAGLQGHKAAERLAVSLEQYLTTDDIIKATDEAQSFLETLPTKTQQTLAGLDAELESKQAYLDQIYADIDSELHITLPEVTIDDSLTPIFPDEEETVIKKEESAPKKGGTPKKKNKKTKREAVLKPLDNIFTQNDRP